MTLKVRVVAGDGKARPMKVRSSDIRRWLRQQSK